MLSINELISVHARIHVRSHMCVSTHMENPQQERKVARANINTIRAITSANRSFVATRVPFSFCFQNSLLSCFTLNETFDMLQQQETLYYGYTNLGSHLQLQICMSIHSCRQRRTYELTLFPGAMLGKIVGWVHNPNSPTNRFYSNPI